MPAGCPRTRGNLPAMRARAFRVGGSGLEGALGSVLAADARTPEGRVALRKGTRIGDEHRATLAALAGVELHLVDLEAGELPQEEVARRLATALAGPGTSAREPQQGQARVLATRHGLLRARAEAVRALNAGGGILCFTLPDGQVVLEGDEVAGVKAATLATAEQVVAEAEAVARGAALAVAPFARRRVRVLVTERLEAKARALVAGAIGRKIAWYGSELLAFAEVAHEPGAVAAELRASLEGAADLILVSGAGALDPLDPVFVAIESLGGAVLRRGVPAHPGSMVWVATVGTVPVLGIATCSGFGKNTSLDLLLARVLADEDPASAADALGHGGLVEGTAAAARFPPYERPRATPAPDPAGT